MSRFRPKLTYANVMASIAVFGVLAGGSAWAHGKIGSNQIKPNAVAAKHLKNNAVKAGKIANNGVRPNKLHPRAKAAWAKVNGNGEVVAQSGGIEVNKGNDGLYTVDFGFDVSNRAVTATGAITLGSINVGVGGITTTDPHSVIAVHVWEVLGGNLIDHPFTIVATP